MIEGAIFDLDGTLLDSLAVWDTLDEDYLRSLGVVPTEDLSQTFKSFSLYEAACYYQNVYGIQMTAQEIMDGIKAMVQRAYAEEIALKPDAAQFLKKLREKGIPMCVATAGERDLAEAVLERCGVRGCFSEIFTCTSVGCSKRDPEIYRQAQAHLGTPKNKTVVFEDALFALKTARADGFVTAAVYEPYEQDQNEMRALCDFYLTSYRDFAAFWQFASVL